MSIPTQTREEAFRRRMRTPHIKRQAGTWVCLGGGVVATGITPAGAYSTWLIHIGFMTYARMLQEAR